MPSVKRTGVKSREVKTGFEAYEGPEPTRRGMYRARIVRMQWKEYRTGSVGFPMTVVFEADAKNDPNGKAEFDGFPLSGNIVLGEKEQSIIRENNLYAALGVKDEPTIAFADGDPKDGLKITKVGGKDPLGMFVLADLDFEDYNGSQRPSLNGIYKLKDGPGTKGPVKAKDVVVEDDEDDDESDMTEDDVDAEEGDEEQDEVEAEIEARTVELKKLTLVKLKAAAKELEIDVAGLKKDDLVEAILDAEYGEDDEEAEDEDEDDEDTDVEAEDDEEEDEEEDEDGEAELRAELADLDRTALKARLKEADAEFRILKKHTEDDLIEAIVAAETGDSTPF